MKKIALIPIDNRPICYTLVRDILAQDDSIELFMPEREYLGALKKNADIENIYDFIKNMPKADILVISLDTIAYGGLVSSRRCPETFGQIRERLLKFKEIIKQKSEKTYAFSSIMRISNNNINEEEKEYWSQWGKKIFEFSYYQHKSRREKSQNCVYNQIPEDILNDYLDTRKRNFDINKLYLDWLEDKTLDMLVFSKDDTGEYGLNVEEAELLEKEIKNRGLNAQIKTGADEIPLTLIARALAQDKNISVGVDYTHTESINKISRYEDISVKDCVESQLRLANCTVSTKGDLKLIVNNFENAQGDWVLGDFTNSYKKNLTLPDENFFIADISNANGADEGFVRELIKNKCPQNLYGYCAYNTSANSIGCAVFCAVTKFLAKKNNSYNDHAFKKLMFIRLLDDWVYQTKIRKSVREAEPDFFEMLKSKRREFSEYEKIIAKYLDFEYNDVDYTLPWARSFEAEIDVKSL